MNFRTVDYVFMLREPISITELMGQMLDFILNLKVTSAKLESTLQRIVATDPQSLKLLPATGFPPSLLGRVL